MLKCLLLGRPSWTTSSSYNLSLSCCSFSLLHFSYVQHNCHLLAAPAHLLPHHCSLPPRDPRTGMFTSCMTKYAHSRCSMFRLVGGTDKGHERPQSPPLGPSWGFLARKWLHPSMGVSLCFPMRRALSNHPPAVPTEAPQIQLSEPPGPLFQREDVPNLPSKCVEKLKGERYSI